MDAIEVAVDVDLQQVGRMVGRPTSFSRDDAIETQLAKIEFIDENIAPPYRVGVHHVVIQALGKQRALTSMLSPDKALHLHLPLI